MYDNGVNGCWIENYSRANNWHHDLWTRTPASSALLSLPRLLSISRFVYQFCCTAARNGPSTDITLRSLRHFIFVVCRASSASAIVAENTTRWVVRQYWNNPGRTLAVVKATALAGACYPNAWKSTSTSATLCKLLPRQWLVGCPKKHFID